MWPSKYETYKPHCQGWTTGTGGYPCPGHGHSGWLCGSQEHTQSKADAQWRYLQHRITRKSSVITNNLFILKKKKKKELLSYLWSLLITGSDYLCILFFSFFFSFFLFCFGNGKNKSFVEISCISWSARFF